MKVAMTPSAIIIVATGVGARQLISITAVIVTAMTRQ